MGGSGVVTGEQDRCQAEATQPADRVRAAGPESVGDDEHRAGGAVPAGEHRRTAVPFGGLGCLLELVGDVQRPLLEQATATSDDLLVVHRPPHTEAVDAAEVLDVRQFAEPFPCPVGDRPRDRVPAGRLDRADQPQHLVDAGLRTIGAGTSTAGAGISAVRAGGAGAGCNDRQQAHPPGGQRPGLVQDDGVHPPGRFQYLRPFDQDAELGATAAADEQRGGGRQAERARAGDDQHGHRGRERCRRPLAESEPHREGDGREADHDRDEHGRHPVGEPLDRGLAALRLDDQFRDLRELGVRAHPGGPDHQPTVGVHGGAGDRVTHADLDRHRLAGEHARVHRATALLHDPVGGDLLAWAHHEAVAHGQLFNADPQLLAVPQDRHVPGAQFEQRPQRGAGPPLGARLEEASGEDERRHHGGDLEVDAVRAAAPVGGWPGGHARHARHARHPRVAGRRMAEEQGVQRPAERRERADGDQRVHGRRAVAQVRPRRPVERQTAPQYDRGGQRQRQPLPVVELPRRHHGEQQHRQAQQTGDDQP